MPNSLISGGPLLSLLCVQRAFVINLPLLVGEGGELVCRSVGKADLLPDHFDGKQSRESVDLPLNSHRSPRLTTFAFR